MRSRFGFVAAAAALSLAATGSALAQPVVFTEVSADAGVDMLQWDGDTRGGFGPDLEMLFMSAGAAAGDYDGDGLVDLFVTRLFAPNLLYRNNGDGTFEEVGAQAGVDLTARSSGCSWADVNNDGLLDLYVLTLDTEGRNYLYINSGDGTFTESAAYRGVGVRSPHRDFERHDRFPTAFCQRCCTSAAFGDYDLDGALDLSVVEWGRHANPRNLLFNNNGNGFFTDVTKAAGVQMPYVRAFAPTFADIDLNGWPDLLVAADFGTSRLFINNGNGGFVDMTEIARVGTDENGMGSAVGDIDNDGDHDWFVTSIWDPDDTCNNGGGCNWGGSGNRLFRNDTKEGIPISTRFTDATDHAGVRDGAWGWGASFFDFDNDGDLDLGMTNGIDMPGMWEDNIFNDDLLRLWQNDGTGVMTEIGESVGFDDDGSGKGFVVFDYDADGDMDVFVANNKGYPALYRNDGGNDNDWLQVELRGTTTNSFGVGARVYVKADANSTEQMREMICGNNYMSQNELVAHFGLGADDGTVHSVRVVWPASGQEQTFFDVAANQRVIITEP